MKYAINDIISRMLGLPLRMKALRGMNFPPEHSQITAQDPEGRRLNRYLGRLIVAGVSSGDIKRIARETKEGKHQ